MFRCDVLAGLLPAYTTLADRLITTLVAPNINTDSIAGDGAKENAQGRSRTYASAY